MQKWFVGDCVTFYDPNKFQSGERDPALQLTHGGTYYIRKIAHRFLNDKKTVCQRFNRQSFKGYF